MAAGCAVSPPLASSSPPHQPEQSHLFALALVFFSLGALLVSGSRRRSSRARQLFFLLRRRRTPPRTLPFRRNWTSPPAAVRVVDGDTVVAAEITVRLLGMDAPEDGQLCSRRGIGGSPSLGEKDKKNNFFFSSRAEGGEERQRRHLRRRRRRHSSSPAGHALRPAFESSRSSSSSQTYDCGTEATRALRCLVAGKSLRCERKGTDRYGRALARCFVNETQFFSFFSCFLLLFPSEIAAATSSSASSSVSISANGCSSGHAVSSSDSRALPRGRERKAKKEQRGIWAGEFELPKVWREKRRKEREARAKEEEG